MGAEPAPAAARRVMITGATGFIGRHLVAHFLARGLAVTAAVRALPSSSVRHSGADYVAVGDVGPETDWHEALDGVTHVVHAAAHVHVMGDGEADGFTRVNELGTARVAEQAAACGIRRLVLLSSIKVNGERTTHTPFRAEDPPRPEDPYGRSKLAAEQALWRVCADGRLDGVVVRLPLVYGPGVKANFLRLVRLVESGLPLPLASIDNRRSLVSVWNLCEFIGCVLEHPRAVGHTWLIADGEDLSTPELVRRIGRALRRPARLVPVPTRLLRTAGRLTGRAGEVERLAGSLQVDSSPAGSELGFRPPLTVDESLSRTVAALRARPEAR
jgi:nucleoside-diphosphate-sugar epimerase